MKKMLTKSLKGKDFISLMDYFREELETILEVAIDLKRKLALGEPHEYLKNKTLGMIFANPSTRTRTSFEAAMTQLGGHAQFHTPEAMQIAHHETWIDAQTRCWTGILMDLCLWCMMKRKIDFIQKRQFLPWQ